MLLHHFKILLNRTLEPYRIDRCCFLGYIRFAFRAIAQLVSVRVWGARGPGFEFRLPDLKAVQLWTAFFILPQTEFSLNAILKKHWLKNLNVGQQFSELTPINAGLGCEL